MKYLYKKNDTTFAECEECGRILKFKDYQIAEISEGVECFCGSISDSIKNMPKLEKDVNNSQQNYIQDTSKTQASVSVINDRTAYDQSKSAENVLVPKCPTCGSTHIHKISLASKAIGGYMFVIFSSNVRNTFECSNCGYKW